jgi:hypothetical protein
MEDPDIVEIYRAANPFEAHAVANALLAEGINARVVGDFLSGAAGGLPITQITAPCVWVRKEDEAKARHILDQFESEDEDQPEPPDEKPA